MGKAIAIAMRSESSDIFPASPLAFITSFAEIAGTMDTVSGVMNAAGRLNRVCAFP